MCACTALTIRSHRTLSKNFQMSRSITRLRFQQRSRHAATASSAPRCGRYPQESGWNNGSTAFSSRAAATVCAILSATQGTPSTRAPPPCGFGISTAITGGGKQVPGDIRFQTRQRLFFRSFSNSARLTPSIPGAPLFPFTLSQASQTSCLEIRNGLPAAFSSLTRLLPARAG